MVWGVSVIFPRISRKDIWEMDVEELIFWAQGVTFLKGPTEDNG